MSGKIVGSVRGQVLHLIYPPLVEGTVDYLTAEFSFSGDWDGLSKWAHFKQGSTIYDVPLTKDTIIENQHLNLGAGTWDVYLHGSGDNRRITTTTVRMKVLPYLDEDGEPLPEVPLTFSEVLDQRAQRIQAVAYAVEAGESDRKEAERSRELSEFARVQAEADRTGAEAGRASAEAIRASAETARESAEQDRISAENSRSSAEDTRKTNEEARQAAEAIREQNEEARVEAEKNRKDGITPHIGDNGNWYLGDTDTGKPSRGETGAGMDITGATVDQIAKITAVDDTGKPTAWEAVDMPISFKPAGRSYLTFSSPNSFTLAVNDSAKHWDGTLEYFASDKTWTTWDGTTTLSAVSNDGEYVLYLRGTGNTVITGSSANHRWVLTGTDIKCIGNIENLLDYTTVASGEHPTMASSCYSFMFRGCTGLTQAPELPATTLADNCYQGMFQGCTSIAQAPALPAITLASYCYNSMFYGCKGLIQAPALPATTLENSCYSYIFSGCTSLTQAPALPATTLANRCYYYMFYGCPGLIQAPALPATTLADSCYYYMFQGCTALTQAPALPATTLKNYCYRGMFYGCTSLKLSSTKTGEYTQEYRIPSSGDGVAATDALADMFTSTGGTFTGTPAINTTYYLSSDNMIVRETEIDTLNGYVGSMIDVAIAEHTSNPLNITGATVGQIAKITAVDDSGKPTAWEAVDDRLPNASSSDIGRALAVEQTGEFEYGYGFADIPNILDFINLGIDAASPGQFVKVAYVDDFGKPIAWEAVDMPSGGGGGHWETVLDTVWQQDVINPTAYDAETGIFTCAAGELDNLALDTEYVFFQQCVKEGVAYNTILGNENLKVTKLSDTTFSIDVTPPKTFVPTNVKFSKGVCLAVTDIDAKKIRLTLDGQFKPTATLYDNPFFGAGKSYFGMNTGYMQIRNAYHAYQQVTAEVESPYRIVGKILCGFNAPSNAANFHFKNNSFCCPLVPYYMPEGNQRPYFLNFDGTKIAKLYSTSAPHFIGNAYDIQAIANDYLRIISGTKVKLERWVE